MYSWVDYTVDYTTTLSIYLHVCTLETRRQWSGKLVVVRSILWIVPRSFFNSINHNLSDRLRAWMVISLHRCMHFVFELLLEGHRMWGSTILVRMYCSFIACDADVCETFT